MFWLIPIALGLITAGCAADSDVELQPPAPTPCGDDSRLTPRNQSVAELSRQRNYQTITYREAFLGTALTSFTCHFDRRLGWADAECRTLFNESVNCAGPMLEGYGLSNPSNDYHIFATPETTVSSRGEVGSYTLSTGEFLFNSNNIEGMVHSSHAGGQCSSAHFAHEWSHRLRLLSALNVWSNRFNGYERMVEEGFAAYSGHRFSVPQTREAPPIEQQEELDFALIRQASRSWQECREGRALERCPDQSISCCATQFPGAEGPHFTFDQADISLQYYLGRDPVSSQEVLVLGIRLSLTGEAPWRVFASFDLTINSCENLYFIPPHIPIRSACLIPNAFSNATRGNLRFFSQILSMNVSDLECGPTERRTLSLINLGNAQIGTLRGVSEAYSESANPDRPFASWNYFDGWCLWEEMENRYGFEGIARIVQEAQRIGEETQVCRQINFAQLFASALRVTEPEIDDILRRYFVRQKTYQMQYLPPIRR